MPHLLEGDFFHSLELFQILEKTPGITPFMAVATQENKVVGQMLVILYHRKSLFPPYLYTHAHAYGEGLYAPDAERNAIFPLLLRSITIHLHKRLCFYIEFSRMSKKMLGYREFRNWAMSLLPGKRYITPYTANFPKSDSQTNKLL